MSIWSRIQHWISRDRAGRHLAERDAPADTGTAPTRATGGVSQPDSPDTHSTTGTTPSGTFVGRAGGDDPGNLDEPSRHSPDTSPTDADDERG